MQIVHVVGEEFQMIGSAEVKQTTEPPQLGLATRPGYLAVEESFGGETLKLRGHQQG